MGEGHDEGSGCVTIDGSTWQERRMENVGGSLREDPALTLSDEYHDLGFLRGVALGLAVHNDLQTWQM